MSKKVMGLLLVIVVAASFLRLYRLSTDPPGLTWDEAALGYNAYSILKTGMDEYGKFLPVTLQSFGDYKPAMYAYFTVPSVAIFGLNEFAVRFPNAIFGTLAIILTFFITRRLFKKDSLALCAATVLAFSPWHIHFSRGAWEVDTALTIILFGVWCFMKGLSKPWWFLGTVVAFALSVYTYQSSRLFMPLIAFVLVLIYWKDLWPLKKAHVVALILGVILLIPLAKTLTDGQSTSRLQVQSMFSYTRPDAETDRLASIDHVASDSAQFQLFHSQAEQFGRAIIERELMYLSPSYLFVTGDTAPRHHAPGVAHGYWIDILFYLLGFYVLFKLPWDRRTKWLIVAWLLIAPLPAVLSRDNTQALRSLNLVFAVDLVIGLGVWYFLRAMRHTYFGRALALIAAGLFIFCFAFYLDAYYIHMPARTGPYWLTGYKEAIQSIRNVYNDPSKVDHVIFTTDDNEPYIYVLFYLKVDPAHYQQQARLTQTRGIDVGEVPGFDNFGFRHIYWPNDRSLPKTLFIGTEDELPDQDLVTEPRASLLRTIKYADKTTAFKIVLTK